MADTTQVNVKLPVDQKREWEDYVEENEEATSLSHLIRLSVQREINGESKAGDIEVAGDELDLDLNLDSVHSRLDQMESTLTEVSDTVSAMETGRLADEDQIEEIADRIYDTMPRRATESTKDAPDLRPREVADQLVENVHNWMEMHGADVSDLADKQNWDYGLVEAYRLYFNVDNYTMQRVLERVQEYSSRVHYVDTLEYDVIFEEE